MTSGALPIFHLAFPVKDIPSTLEFYRDKLKFPVDLIEEKRCIINLCGHQAVAHLAPDHMPKAVTMYPRHFGIIFEKESDFESLLGRAKASRAEFFQECFIRFPDSPRAHKSFFLKDPSNNLLEFKWYQDIRLVNRAQEA